MSDFCARKGGAKVGKKFFPLSTSNFLFQQLKRKFKKLEARAKRRDMKEEQERIRRERAANRARFPWL